MATKGMSVFRANGEDYTLNDQNITDEFSSSTAYAVGDYVNYQGDLYVFKAAHAAGSWNAAHVMAVKLGANLVGLKDTENADMAEVGGLDDVSMKWVTGIDTCGVGFVNTSGVLQTGNTNYKYAKYPVLGTTKKIKATSIYVYGQDSNYCVFAAYDSSDNFITGITNKVVNTGATGNTFTNVYFTVPDNTAYVIITFANMSSSSYFANVEQEGVYGPAGKMKRVFNMVPGSDYKSQIYFHDTITNIGKSSLLDFNGKFRFDRPVESYDVFWMGYTASYAARHIYKYFSALTEGISGNTVEIHSNFWDGANDTSGDTYIGMLVNFKFSKPSTTTAEVGIQLMNNFAMLASYCTINDYDITLTNYPANIGFMPTSALYSNANNPMFGGRLCCIGDSLTAVYYKSEEESWPCLIAKWNNMAYDNLGVSSRPIAKTDQFSSCMAEAVDDIPTSKRYTHIFLMGGANDYNYSIPIGTNTDTEITTFKGAINHIISKLVEKFPTARIVFATTYQRTSNQADKPYADAMLELCQLHGMPCLDNYRSSGVLMNNSDWMAKFGADNTTSNKHLNAAGDLFVAPRFENALKYGV